MVNINASHKGKNQTSLEWFDNMGQIEKLNVTTLSDTDLFVLRNRIREWSCVQLAVVDDEISRWEPIFCSVCGKEDLAFRGKPFITWGMRGGYTLCPQHTLAFDRVGTPEAELIKQTKAEDREIKELFT